MSEIGRQALEVDATTLMAAGAGAVVLGGVAYLLTRSTGASHAVEAGSALLFGLLGAFAAVAVSRRAAVPPEEEDDEGAKAHQEASPGPEESEITCVARYLGAHLGGKVTAYLSGADDPKVVDLWASGELEPEALSDRRLRGAYEAARYIVEAYDDETAQAWFVGMNQRLDDEAPASLLRHGQGPEDWRFIVPAAREFVESAR